MRSAGLRTAKQGAAATGGMMPSKRSPLSGSSAETIGAWSVTSRRTCAATMRTMRSASAAPMRSPLSCRPTPLRSIHRRPSGLTISSITVGSASAAAMLGPKAVRSICRRRPCASSVPAVVMTSAMTLSYANGVLLGWWVGGARRLTGGGGEQVGLVLGDALHHLRHQPPVAGKAPPDLGDEHIKALPAQQPRRLLLALRQRRRDGEEVAHVERQGFGGDGDVAADAGDATVELIETAAQRIIDAGQRLRLEQRLQGLFDEPRLAAPAALSDELEPLRQRARQAHGIAFLAHLEPQPRKLRDVVIFAAALGCRRCCVGGIDGGELGKERQIAGPGRIPGAPAARGRPGPQPEVIVGR